MLVAGIRAGGENSREGINEENKKQKNKLKKEREGINESLTLYT